jgi:hypothetical protein
LQFYANWSVMAVYQYVDLGAQTVRPTAGFAFPAVFAPSSFNAVFHDQIHVVRAGINYHF